MNSLYITLSPESYDYAYVETVGFIKGTRESWRVVKVSDMPRFLEFQMPRYRSGFYAAFAFDSESAYHEFGPEELKDFIARVRP